MRRLVLWLTLMMAAWGVMLMASTPVVVAQSPPEFNNLRTKDTKTFVLGPGERQTVFGHDFHYNDNGEWKDVDLGFRNGVSDRASVTVRLQAQTNLIVTETDSGKGVRFTLPADAFIVGDTVQYTHKGLTWVYSLTKAGIKLAAEVTAPQGPQTYVFNVTFLGTSGNENNGRIEAPEFIIKNPVIIDANSERIKLNWTQDPGEIKFTFDDTGIALPYTIDPTTTFTGGASGDDGHFQKQDATGWPPAACTGEDLTDDVNRNGKREVSDPTFLNQASMIRWDTSAIPDTATITSATFDPVFDIVFDSTDNRALNAEYYSTSNWPITCASDHVDNVGTTAFSEDLTQFDGNEGNRENITMSSPTSISKTGFTGLRLGISGGEPSFGLFNNANFFSFDNGTDDATITVTYDIDPDITSFSPTQVGDESSVGVTATGTDFDTDAQIIMQQSGETDINCTAEVTNGPGTSITATCNFTGVALGLWDARVENGASNSDTLVSATRVYSRPTITTISPVDAENDTSFTLTVNGSEFDTVDPAVVTLTRSGESTITCTGGTSSATVLTRSCPITGALEGDWSVVVTNGTVLAATLTDGLDIWSTLGTPTITSVTPTLSSNTSPVNLTLFGTNFDDADTQSLTGAQVTMSGPGSPITCTGEDVTNGNTRVAATCDITSATTGLWQITVTNNGGAQASIGFTVAGAGGSGSSGDPSGSIDDVLAYDSVLEDDDLLVVVVYNLTFTSTLPISDTFLCRFLASGVDQNASEILVFNDLGYGLGICSFYWTAAQKLASSIEFENPNGEIYEAVLQGKASAFDIPLRFTNENVKWRDPRNTSTLLSRNIVSLATRLQNDPAWAANSVVLLNFIAGQTVLSSDGESYFGRAIPNLASMVPDLFSSSVTSPFINETEFGFSETDQLQNFWDGSVLEDSMQAGGDLFNVDPIYFTTFIGLAIVIAVISIGTVATKKIEFGLITTAVTVPLMAVVGLLSLNFVVVVAALAVLALGFVLFLRRA